MTGNEQILRSEIVTVNNLDSDMVNTTRNIVDQNQQTERITMYLPAGTKVDSSTSTPAEESNYAFLLVLFFIFIIFVGGALVIYRYVYIFDKVADSIDAT